jgi:hydrogenase expression/formation protein HypD
MKYVDEYRNATEARKLADRVAAVATRPWTLMEVCGGQTHAIVKYGLDQLLPETITLIHGPGCPVCVTPLADIDKAIALAGRPEVIFCSFGDMLRVPGSRQDLLAVKAEGADVRTVYSPLDALDIARQNPRKQVVFFAVGFETTAPATALAAHQAKRQSLTNFSLLVSHVRVPPAIEALLASPQNRVQGFLAAGHVCTVMGYTEYESIVQRYRVPIVVTGFEPVDILCGVYGCIRQLEQGRFEVENQYKRSVRREGNVPAQGLMERVFQVVTRRWRGLNEIPQSGLALRPDYQHLDAEQRFGVQAVAVEDPVECRSGEVLQGILKPHQCPAFGARCTPEHPLGATMVSSEGACAAYYRYRRSLTAQAAP